MASKKPKTVLYRRKRERKTDYKKRLNLLASRKPRLVVRFTNKQIIAQIIEFSSKGDKIIVGIDSSSLKKQGWNYSYKNMPAAYLAGNLIGKEAVSKGCKVAILDTGFKTPLNGGKIYAFLKGVLDGGLEVPHSEKNIFPSDDRLNGTHIKTYSSKLKEDGSYEKRFTEYLKKNIQPEKITEEFEKIKSKP